MSGTRRFITPPDLPTATTDNPYWEIVRTIPGDSFSWECDKVWSPAWVATLATGTLIDRDDLCNEYAWAIADPASLAFTAKWLAPRAVEIGAGVGYWAWQLSQLGIDMLAYDLFPPQQTGQNHYHSPRTAYDRALKDEVRSVFFDVRAGNHQMAAAYPERTLFLCWPPYDDDMASLCLQAYQGKRLVFIGEDSGGCTADDAFFEALGKDWEEVAFHRPIQWFGMHDGITVYERKRSVPPTAGKEEGA